MRFLQASVNVNQVITTYTVVASAFLSAVAFVNSGTQRSVDDLKMRVDSKFADAKKDTESKFADAKKDTDSKFADAKKDTESKFADLKKDTDSKFAISFILSGATLATVLYMAAATAAPLTR